MQQQNMQNMGQGSVQTNLGVPNIPQNNLAHTQHLGGSIGGAKPTYPMMGRNPATGPISNMGPGMVPPHHAHGLPQQINLQQQQARFQAPVGGQPYAGGPMNAPMNPQMHRMASAGKISHPGTQLGTFPTGAPVTGHGIGAGASVSETRGLQSPSTLSTAAIQNSLPSNFSSDVMSKVPMNTIKSITEWSDKLKAEGKDVTSELTMYEQLIKKDSEYLTKLLKQIHDNKLLTEELARNLAAYNQIKQLRMNAISIAAKGLFNNSIWGEGYQGYGNGTTNTSTKLILPDKDWTDKQINDRVLETLAKSGRELVPIRLDFDAERDRFKLRDTFLWDLNEKSLTVESFVRQLITDSKFIPMVHFDLICAAVREQINDYQRTVQLTPGIGELRVPIKVDITINNTQLTDQFEWDILNAQPNDPEDFATVMCDEMNLPGEFATAIVHIIREQTQLYHKALTLVGYNFDGSPVQEEEIRSHLLPNLRVSSGSKMQDDFLSIFRNPGTVGDYTPSLVKLTQLEVERLDKEIERESRRKRRHLNLDLEPALNGSLSLQNRSVRRNLFHGGGRGGPTLPELSDMPKTFRTPAPSSILPGAVDLGVPDVYEYTEIYVNKTQVRNPDYKPPAPPRPPPVVRYAHDPLRGRFHVSIRFAPR